MNTMMGLVKLLAQRGIEFDFYSARSSDVVLNRNVIAQKFLSMPDATHVLMIDTDMMIENRVFEHFLNAEHDFMGAIYAKRRLDLDKFFDLAKDGKDIATAKALASEFLVRFESGRVTFANGFAPVTGIGFGCVLIARTVFETIVAKGLAPSVTDPLAAQFGVGDWYNDFFSPLQVGSDMPLSEDLSFCKRACDTDAIKIMGYIGPGVYHTGDFNYSAPYDRVLRELMDTS